MKTFAELVDGLQKRVWPSGAPENLALRIVDSDPEVSTLPSIIDNMVMEGLYSAQQWTACLRLRNVNVHPACSLFFKCGLSITDIPNGDIQRIYTIGNNDFCDPVHLLERDWPEPEVKAKNLVFASPPNTGMDALPIGVKFSEASADSLCGRARTGIWSKWNQKIYVYPWLQSYESLVVEWRGIKKEWALTDLVDDQNFNLETVLKLFLQFAFERDYGCDRGKLSEYKQLYDDAMADMINECHYRLRRNANQNRSDERGPTALELEAELVAP